LVSANSVGILVGLIVGKPMGIVLFSLLAVAIGLYTLPSDMRKRDLLGVGFLAGIGFTMSIFITLLAFKEADIITHSKIAVFIASLVAGLLGFVMLKITLPKIVEEEEIIDPSV
jgi:Na+:H+ antiporter, NhaA family